MQIKLVLAFTANLMNGQLHLQHRTHCNNKKESQEEDERLFHGVIHNINCQITSSELNNIY